MASLLRNSGLCYQDWHFDLVGKRHRLLTEMAIRPTCDICKLKWVSPLPAQSLWGMSSLAKDLCLCGIFFFILLVWWMFQALPQRLAWQIIRAVFVRGRGGLSTVENG